MRAKFINEIQNFEQGGNPYKKLNIGQYKKPQVGDVFVLNTNIMWLKKETWESTTESYGLSKGTYIKIKQIERVFTTGKTVGVIFIVADSDPMFAYDYWMSYEQLIEFTS